MSAISSTSDSSWLRAASSLEVDAPAAPLRPGSLLARGRFRVVRELGRGGMGVVYQAFDHAREQLVALKTLLRLGPRHLQHLKQEFRALSELNHPNVVRLHGLHCDDGLWFITMQLIDGTTLAARAFAPHELRPLFAQIARGMDALHSAGLIHRDLKPSNVMVGHAGEVVIVDFGLVSTLDATPHSSRERFCGTPSYAAPEQKAGAVLQAPADWYAFGVMLRESWSRSVRSEAPSPPWSPEYEAELGKLCGMLLEEDPSMRAGAAEVLAAFD
ncbi:MAG TPA: serine/threonine-protein kinase, partial [Polyangiales bacterium]